MSTKHSVPHDLPRDVARKVADHALQAYASRFSEYAPQVSWTTPHSAEVSFKAKGVTLKGAFEILDKSIDIEMEVPLLLRPFRQKAIDVVEEQIKEWIGKAKSGVAL